MTLFTSWREFRSLYPHLSVSSAEKVREYTREQTVAKLGRAHAGAAESGVSLRGFGRRLLGSH